MDGPPSQLALALSNDDLNESHHADNEDSNIDPRQKEIDILFAAALAPRHGEGPLRHAQRARRAEERAIILAREIFNSIEAHQKLRYVDGFPVNLLPPRPKCRLKPNVRAGPSAWRKACLHCLVKKMPCSFTSPLIGREKDRKCSRCKRNEEVCIWSKEEEKIVIRSGIEMVRGPVPREYVHCGEDISDEERIEKSKALFNKLLHGTSVRTSGDMMGGERALPLPNWRQTVWMPEDEEVILWAKNGEEEGIGRRSSKQGAEQKDGVSKLENEPWRDVLRVARMNMELNRLFPLQDLLLESQKKEMQDADWQERYERREDWRYA